MSKLQKEVQFGKYFGTSSTETEPALAACCGMALLFCFFLHQLMYFCQCGCFSRLFKSASFKSRKPWKGYVGHITHLSTLAPCVVFFFPVCLVTTAPVEF